VLTEMKKEILIIVRLEKKFPLAFFDVMICLVVQLLYEALL
jgi:hypothetical protein